MRKRKKPAPPLYVMVQVVCPEISPIPIMSHFVWLEDAADGAVKVHVGRYELESVAELVQGN